MALALGKLKTGTPKFWGSGCCEHAEKPNRLNTGVQTADSSVLFMFGNHIISWYYYTVFGH
jgi:hypothetical protein